MKKLVSLILFIVILVSLFSGCKNGASVSEERELSSDSSIPLEQEKSKEEPSSQEKVLLKRYSKNYIDYFDTVTILIGYSETEEEFDRWAEKFGQELKNYHELFDIYNNYDGINNIKTINDNAGNKPVEVDVKLIEILEFGIEMYRETDGITNMAMGSVLKIWHDYRENALENIANAKVPPMDILKEAAEHMDINDVIIDRTKNTVYLADPKMSLDIGSLGKGYAVEKICQTMESQGLDHFLLNAGGNVRAIGKKGDGTPWNTGLENPYGEEDLMGVVALDGKALVTSGNYQRFYEIDGFRYHHIIDPYTLMPKNHISSVTILCNDSGLADALSTALFNMTVEDGLKWVEARDDIEAMWLLPDKTEVYSSGFKENMTNTK